MLLDRIIEKPEKGFRYSEKRINNENFTADVKESYKRGSVNNTFNMPFILLNLEQVRYYESSPSENIKKFMRDGKKIKFFIHPEMIEHYKTNRMNDLINFAGSIKVSSTSSTRTVFSYGLKHNLMIKVNLEKRLGESVKKLNDKHIAHSLKISKEFKDYKMPDNFAYLPETIGEVYFYNGKNIGMIVREFDPRPSLDCKTILIPLFSVFSEDTNNKEDHLILRQIIERTEKKGRNNIELCFDLVIKPYLNIWAYFVLNLGLNLEMHAQNTLLQLNKEGHPIRIVYRDLQDTFIDTQIRKLKGLHTNFNKNVMGNENKTFYVENRQMTDSNIRKQISYSLTYDYRIGRALDHFYNFMSKHYSCDKKLFQALVKGIWNHNFKGTELLPKEAYFLKPNQTSFEKKILFERQKTKYR